MGQIEGSVVDGFCGRSVEAAATPGAIHRCARLTQRACDAAPSTTSCASHEGYLSLKGFAGHGESIVNPAYNCRSLETQIERDDLVAALHERGVCYLAPTPTGGERALTDEELLIGLSQTKDARLRFSLAGLLLVHPTLASICAELIEARHIRFLPKNVLAELQKQYLAAMYLQRMWRTRLRMAIGEQPLIPERFTQDLALPSADAMHGEMGLHHLVDSSPFNEWSSYQQVIDLICDQPCVTDGVIALGT